MHRLILMLLAAGLLAGCASLQQWHDETFVEPYQFPVSAYSGDPCPEGSGQTDCAVETWALVEGRRMGAVRGIETGNCWKVTNAQMALLKQHGIEGEAVVYDTWNDWEYWEFPKTAQDRTGPTRMKKPPANHVVLRLPSGICMDNGKFSRGLFMCDEVRRPVLGVRSAPTTG